MGAAAWLSDGVRNSSANRRGRSTRIPRHPEQSSKCLSPETISAFPEANAHARNLSSSASEDTGAARAGAARTSA